MPTDAAASTGISESRGTGTVSTRFTRAASCAHDRGEEGDAGRVTTSSVSPAAIDPVAGPPVEPVHADVAALYDEASARPLLPLLTWLGLAEWPALTDEES